MQATENYSDRRRNERRHDSSRDNPGSGNLRRSKARRHDLRLDLSFDVLVLDYDGKTVNISANGVYLKVITSDIGVFPPGATIPLQINAVTNRPEERERKFKLSGRGTILRNCIIESQDHDNSLGVALKFTEKLNTELDND